ncbi:hypothetical protein CROQUDRAFT_652588 [Cronartium quercuum f. sp. fusiforme G11]|uniref:Uncharacterized protein n=1 Tax=Cronartium quercuum f. sp. fusiforme G11 TaxID=708437 RepID=A0A9P6NQ68_9BASI|nr:hypothetical protein CROQUDRAFT_652588 [Cronartium quercuum f. sp. fusiforme G11]
MATFSAANSAASNSSPESLAPAFNTQDCVKYLASRHTTAMEGVHAASNGTTPVSERVELYKPPGATNLAGSWGSGKHTSMTNGQDFLATLWAKFETSPAYQSYLQAAASHPSAPNSTAVSTANK